MDLEKFYANDLSILKFCPATLELRNGYNTMNSYMMELEKFYVNVTSPNCPVMSIRAILFQLLLWAVIQ